MTSRFVVSTCSNRRHRLVETTVAEEEECRVPPDWAADDAAELIAVITLCYGSPSSQPFFNV